MQALRELQTRFIDYLTGESADGAPSIHADDAHERALRLDIYKNAYHIRLREVIETDHDMLWSYLGDELFEQMVNGYIASHPSHCTSLRYFCNQLPDYLATTGPFDQHPIIAEIATFERLLMDAFDAAGADRADLPELRALSPDDWPGMQLRFHPSVQLLKMHWNSVESWKALKDDDEPPAANDAAVQHWLLWRDDERLSQYRPLDEDEQAVLLQAIAGDDFATLCEALLNWYPVEQASVAGLQYITAWLEQGLITAIEAGSKDSTPRLA